MSNLRSLQRPITRSPLRRLALSGLFWLGLAVLSVLAVAALGAMSTVIS